MTTLLLYQPPGVWGSSSASPFCIKVECYLRLAGIPFESRPADMRKAPKGKMPFVDLGGTLLGDSQLIVDHLKVTHGDPLDAALTDAQRAVGHSVRRMLEEATYFVGVYQRWFDDDGWPVLKPAFASILPAPIRLAMPLIRREVKKALHAQGTSRHAKEEVYAMAIADWKAVAVLLGDKPFLLGDAPTSFDCTVYAFLEGMAGFPVDNVLTTYMRGEPRLASYRTRMKARVFGG